MTIHRILAGVFLTLAVACSGAESEAPGDAAPQAEATPAETLGNQTVIDTGSGQAAETASEALPKGFPSDLPMFPDAMLTASLIDPGEGSLVRWSSEAALADVSSFYQAKLPSQGWIVSDASETRKMTRIQASKGGRKATVMIRRPGDLTEIAITLEGS